MNLDHNRPNTTPLVAPLPMVSNRERLNPSFFLLIQASTALMPGFSSDGQVLFSKKPVSGFLLSWEFSLADVGRLLSMSEVAL